jgi:NAD(P)-dependent dehydrogenase (short-subunit alcohol dehydrogenase family)
MITGAGRGLGHAFAEEAVKNGDKVIATIRKINDTDPLMKNENVLPVIMDVTKKEEVAAAVDAGIRKFGRIDVLINNAQASASGVTIENHTTEQFDLAIYSGLYAAFYYMKVCYPYLKETQGSVINFASGAGISGNFGQGSYAAAKEGIRGL